MKILIVVGEGLLGASGVSISEQSQEFYEYGLDLVEKYLRLKKEDSIDADVEFYIPQSMSQAHSERLGLMSEARREAVLGVTEYYQAIAGLVHGLLRARNERSCLIVIGHGFQIINGGAVQLLTGNGVGNSIDDSNINAIRPDVYIGLHCYPGAILKKLDNTCIACGMTGMNVGQNSHIKSFCESDKLIPLLQDIFSLFLVIDVEEMDAPTIREHEQAVIQAMRAFKDHSTPDLMVSDKASLARSKS
ncbi:hypothetical protein [Chromobacterium piscinae]|uniref:hypothetical protein n=1 Tax=Chromobacterium piscinae TaxID=686831 RepID=UPI00140B4440|nr:hypothetical protein [Chromobacterium piscinae]MBX9296550.1 hypothetical protein [Chromobacterium vaccinii]MBX9347612.1 hypothetical protein [Chromobacterium vaccinii]MBX9356127.1 hypothetical protein [Chromobacterium vaccinii]MCD5330711.1 hypothetical protein [Chromobacterium piscinae]NHQ83248.1 hypothetical protein [Chromobacterium vaccinii]